MEQFNQIKYIQKYNKDHYKVFKVNLKNKELEQLEKYLKSHKLTKAQFLRNILIEKKIIK